jgi:hypothetical protein
VHKHFCDVEGHEWECEGSALRPLAGDTEPSLCMCIRHRTSMEIGDHSECSIELLACPEHLDEQRRRMEESSKAATGEDENDTPDGWDELFRPMTPEESIKFEAKHQFMGQVVYAGLKNLNTGFDAEGIQHFSPTDFGEVINRCEPLHVIPMGIEVFTTDGGFIECVFALDDGSSDEDCEWARRLVQRYKEVQDITMTASFRVPDSLLVPSRPTSNLQHSVDSDSPAKSDPEAAKSGRGPIE